jgi:hypothetical protein
MLSAILLLNLWIVHAVSNAFMDELFSLLWKELLPKDNKMLVSTYEALKFNKAIGLSYDSIHAIGQMGVSSFKAPYCICKCVPNVGPIGLWIGQELF